MTGFEPATACPPDKCATTALHPVTPFLSVVRFCQWNFLGEKLVILVIDAFNLIYKFPDLESLMYEHKLREARLGLIQKLLDYKKYKSSLEMHLFFDGRKEIGSPVEVDEIGRLKIYYSLDQKADESIKQFIKKSLYPKNLYLVSSDKDLIFYSKRYLCKNFTSEEFFTLVNKTIQSKKSKQEAEERIYKNLEKEEINYWLKVFKERKDV